jgi:hypothetical protein
MAVYYDAGGGCFAGECLVKLKNGQLKQIQNLQKGDILHNNA